MVSLSEVVADPLACRLGPGFCRLSCQVRETGLAETLRLGSPLANPRRSLRHGIGVLVALHACLSWSPPKRRGLVCSDNQSALAVLTGNPKNSELARNSLTAVDLLQQRGWTISGLWTPALCSVPGNERADASQDPLVTDKRLE